MADAAAYLAGEQASYVNGHILFATAVLYRLVSKRSSDGAVPVWTFLKFPIKGWVWFSKLDI